VKADEGGDTITLYLAIYRKAGVIHRLKLLARDDAAARQRLAALGVAAPLLVRVCELEATDCPG
jgi:hypothetical protein